jgi:hypothetical protein
MNTSLWGPPAWRVLHGLAAAAPDDVPTWRRVVVALRACLPCIYCRQSFALISQPLPRGHVAAWWWHVHELVNIKLEKPSLPFAELRRRTRRPCAVFAPEDAWLLLGAMACNTDNATSVRDHDAKRAAVCQLIAALAVLVRQAAAAAQCADAAPWLRDLALQLSRVCARWRAGATRGTLLRALIHARELTGRGADVFERRVKAMCVAP